MAQFRAVCGVVTAGLKSVPSLIVSQFSAIIAAVSGG